MTQSATRQLVKRLIGNKLETANAVILGCTHYPAVSDMILNAAHNNPLIIDPAEIVANHAIRILSRFVHFPEGQPSFSACFTTTDVNNPHVAIKDSALYNQSGIVHPKWINDRLINSKHIRWEDLTEQKKSPAETTGDNI